MSRKEFKDPSVFSTIKIFLIGLLAGLIISGFLSYPFLGHRTAERTIRQGEIFSCIGESSEKDDRWYAFVERPNAFVYAIYFKEKPPMRGIATRNEEGQVVFLPVNEQKVIQPPLTEEISVEN